MGSDTAGSLRRPRSFGAWHAARSSTTSSWNRLRSSDGKDILILGSRNLWNDLLFHDLVDELHLMVGTVLLGNGTPQQRPRWGP